MRRRYILLGCAAVLILSGTIWGLRRPKPLYRVTFLPSMGGVETRPHAINDSGRIAVIVRMPNASSTTGASSSASSTRCNPVPVSVPGPSPPDRSRFPGRAAVSCRCAGCYFMNVSREGIRVGRLEFRRRSESHLWQSGRHVRQITVHLCCGDDLRHRNVTAVSGWGINNKGTILGAMTVKGSGRWHAVLLEPMEQARSWSGLENLRMDPIRRSQP